MKCLEAGKEKDMEYRERNDGWIFFITWNSPWLIKSWYHYIEGNATWILAFTWRNGWNHRIYFTRASSYYGCRNSLSSISEHAIRLRLLLIMMKAGKETLHYHIRKVTSFHSCLASLFGFGLSARLRVAILEFHKELTLFIFVAESLPTHSEKFSITKDFFLITCKNNARMKIQFHQFHQTLIQEN